MYEFRGFTQKANKALNLSIESPLASVPRVKSVSSTSPNTSPNTAALYRQPPRCSKAQQLDARNEGNETTSACRQNVAPCRKARQPRALLAITLRRLNASDKRYAIARRKTA